MAPMISSLMLAVLLAAANVSAAETAKLEEGVYESKTAATELAETPESTVETVAPEAPPACLELVDLPAGARVEIDGIPADAGASCIQLSPGAYLVTIFPRAAPPFEDFVEVAGGEIMQLRYVAPKEPISIPLPRRPPEPVLGPALVGASIVTGVTGALWWMMARESNLAAAGILARDDLDEPSRRLILAEIFARQQQRQDVAACSAALSAAFLVAGGVAWALAIQEDDVIISIHPTAEGGLMLRVVLP